MKFKMLIALIVVITAPFLADNTFAQYATVAWRGAQAPGTGGIFYLRLGVPTVNGVCDAGFAADLNTGLPTDQGAWLGKPPALDVIALASDVAPGTGGATFRFVGLPLLTPGSEFLTQGILTSGGGVDGSNNAGIWAGTVGALQLLAREGDQAPDTTVGHVFSTLDRYGTNSPGGGGQVSAVLAGLTGPGVDITNESGIWAGTPGDLRLVTRKGDPAPGIPGLTQGPLHDVWSNINQNGVLGFSGLATDPSTGASISVAWMGPRSNPQPILQTGDTSADMPAGFAFDQIILRSINNAGDATGTGSIAPAIAFGKTVIWRYRGGAVELLMIEDDPVPGLPAGVVWGGIAFEPAMNTDGVVAFESSLAGTGVTSSNDMAVFVGAPGSLTMVAREGDPAPSLGAGVVISGFTRWTLALNAMDQVAFSATLTGTGVTGANNRAIFAGAPGSLVPVIRTGDTIEVAPGVFRTVAALGVLNLAPSGNEDGRYSYFNDDGVVTFNATFTDGNNGVFTWPGDICVPPGNRAPQITSVPPTTGTVGVNYTYDVDATDPDGDTLTYALDSGPIGMFIDPVTGLLQWTVLAGQEGANSVTVRATDPDGLFDTQTFEVVVAGPNQPPTITSTPVTTATAGTPYSYDVDATDPDVGDTLAYSLDVAPVGMGIDPVTGLIQWTPTSAQIGSNAVTVRVEDGNGGIATQSFTVDVAVGNQPPTIITSPVTGGTEGSLYSYDVDATDPDVGDTLTYSLDVAPVGMGIDPVTGLIQWTPTSAQIGSNAVTVRVEDGNGGIATQSFTVDVAVGNQPPTIITSPVTGGTEGSLYSYDVDATDPDVGDTLTYSLDVAPVGMGIDPVTGLIQWTPTSAQIGSNAVTVRVEDGNGGIATQSFTVDVAVGNQPPTIITSPVTGGTEGSLYSYDVDATDPDVGDTLTYSLDVAPVGMGIDPVTGLIQWTPTSAQIGSNAVTVRVEDGNGGIATQSFTVDVDAANLAPIADAGGPYSGTVGVPLMFNGNDSMDPDGSIVTYDWDFGDGSTGIGSTPSNVYMADGTYVVTLTVTDDTGATATATTTAVINLANVSPVADPGGPYTGTPGLALTMDGSGSSDPDGTIVSYEWDFGDGNIGIGPSPSHTYLAAGNYDVTLTVTDNDGAMQSAMTTADVSDSPSNNAPVCDAAYPSTEIIWPPNHKFVPVSVHGVTDADGDAVSISIDSIFQDEPVNTYGDGDTARDGRGIGTMVAEIRAERSGTKKVPGDGRVYHIGFTASDGRGATCSGTVAIGVPHDVKDTPIDGGAIYDSTIP